MQVEGGKLFISLYLTLPVALGRGGERGKGVQVKRGKGYRIKGGVVSLHLTLTVEGEREGRGGQGT